MSRVFDALQEAARHRGPNGAPSEAVWTELGISPAPVPVQKVQRVDKEITAIRPSESTPAVATEEILEAVEVTPEIEVATPEQASPDLTAAKILLDKRARLIPHTTDQAVVEHYRMLRTKILQEREKKFFRSLVVTSASPQEGKTVTVLNLALSFAALPSFRVLVIDGDIRKGSLGDWLGIDRERPGLSNLIEGSARLDQVLLKSEELSFHVIPRGNAQICDLQPSHFDEYFRQLAEQYDLVLVDTPPVNLITDVQIMAASCDAVLLIARAFSTTSKSLEEAVDKLQSFRLIGTVLNAGTPRKSRKYQGYY
jgi:protein-tyrosine kinase